MFTLRQELSDIERELDTAWRQVVSLEVKTDIVENNNYTLIERLQQKKALLSKYEEDCLFYKQRSEKLEALFAKTFTVSATAYAPLDPNAVEGMCYSGDPQVTASGQTSNPGVSVAMDSSIPFGTRVLVEGFGERIVHDRGGAITGNKIDIMMWTLEEVRSFGRQNLQVIVLD